MRTGYATPDKLLRRLFRLKDDLLRVLDRPEIPLHTNASESDIRVFVTKRKVSGGTVSDRGRDARDVMIGLAKTCTKLKIPFFDYLGARLGIPGPLIPPVTDFLSNPLTCLDRTPDSAQVGLSESRSSPTCAESGVRRRYINGLDKKSALHFW
jgi:hypothetical protein